MFTYDVFYIDEGQNVLFQLDVLYDCLVEVLQKAVSAGHHGIVIYPHLNGLPL